MKRLLVFVFTVALLGSCRKFTSVHFDFVVISNTNIHYFNCFSDSWQYRTSLGNDGSSTAISVGESRLTLKNYREKKNDTITLTLTALCDSIYGPTHSTLFNSHQCDFEIAIGLFVDDILVEERRFSDTSANGETFNFIVP